MNVYRVELLDFFRVNLPFDWNHVPRVQHQNPVTMHLQTLLLGLLTAAPALSASCPAKPPQPPPPPPAFANGALLRIMPLGDSITRGVGATSSNGYRKRLVSELEKLANVSMVGTERDGDFAGGADRTRHEGHGGFVIDAIRAEALQPEALAALKPNVVLVHAGTNDAARNLGVAAAGERFERLLVDVRAAASRDAVVIASTMIPAQGDEVVDGRIAAMNRDYVARLERLSAADERIRWVDFGGVRDAEARLDPSPGAGNFKDTLHPNDKGYAFMADRWVEAIKAAETLGLIKKPDEI
ncbi:hypothetical protein MCOR27_010387 [Pyricularia oryzae]|uniref:SGNH hydrolase-type esterase domain-containing protein n=1 Tax=Pyricularia grisea TaxID=148305 RepID=A0ABQ8ND75_PYRGI|nr:hypothetical protein MCOR01_009495 [Pyricularia oryzae]KAI6294742.1 hypothetical protein MCOR33_008201 [Pyricularia grisea]KAI6258868.1 hypothetical protein MCOR19_004798 [Pyricularia oryzae]KAI6267913.1 hypothetical protein MCOR27_010387 [Pyricularia oryzae]KAI6286598.1 hypothetical protein MCOR26_000987 [Pyricularia oryzae]